MCRLDYISGQYTHTKKQEKDTMGWFSHKKNQNMLL